MKIIDITKPTPDIFEGDGLQKMLSMQEGLLKHYIKGGSLIKYPIEVDKKEHQELVRSMMAFFIEELAEAYHCYLEMIDLIYGETETITEDRDEMMDKLMSYNEEVADATHFMLEILIYCNIDSFAITSYYETLLKGLRLDDAFFLEDNILGTCFQYARHCNIHRRIYSDKDYRLCHTIKVDPEIDEDIVKGGKKLSPTLQIEHGNQLWDITYQINMARNLLKKKAWRKSGIQTDEQRFQEQVMEGWLHFMRYLDLAGYTEESIFTVYFKKNQVNLHRIKNNY